MKYSKQIPKKLQDLVKEKLLETIESEQLEVKYELRLSIEINKFLDKKYPTELNSKLLKHISENVIINAISRKVGHPNSGFMTHTADALCLFATSGEMRWLDFLNVNHELKLEYLNGDTAIKEADDKMGEKINIEKENLESVDKKQVFDAIPIESVKHKLDSRLQKYLDSYLTQFEYISLPFAKDMTSISISQIPIPTIKMEIPDIEEYDRKEKGVEKREIKDIKDELKYSYNILIVADGGYGKSTYCKWLYHILANDVINKGEIHFPLYIELKSIQSIKSKIETEIGSNEIILPLLKNYLPVLICDGLDEMTTQSQFLIQEIKDFATLFDGDAKIIITSRNHDFIHDFISIGYEKYLLEKINTHLLPELLITTKTEIAYFKKFIISLGIESEVTDNPFFFTCVILLYKLKQHNISYLNKAKLLQVIIEKNYITDWELGDTRFRFLLQKEMITPISIIQILSLLALVKEEQHILSDFIKLNNFITRDKKVQVSEGFSKECIKKCISMIHEVSNEVSNELIHLFVDR